LIRNLFKNTDVEKFSYGASTSGILLTFYGIWVGLMGFDSQNIEQSIPTLLDGLKLAFGSSIVGLGTSMVINLLFLKSVPQKENDFEKIAEKLENLSVSLNDFMHRSTDMQTTSLIQAMKKLVEELEMGINTETKDIMSKFRTSVEFLREWQEKYVDEIKNVTDAMDKNAKVTIATSEQLDRTNDVLEQLGPVTETIAESIGWVKKALPTMRVRKKLEEDETSEN
jgi:uncharacterized membrane protein YgaE (UPF0421/DUF939 family)